jgi:hypothetical protein
MKRCPKHTTKVCDRKYLLRAASCAPFAQIASRRGVGRRFICAVGPLFGQRFAARQAFQFQHRTVLHNLQPVPFVFLQIHLMRVFAGVPTVGTLARSVGRNTFFLLQTFRLSERVFFWPTFGETNPKTP